MASLDYVIIHDLAREATIAKKLVDPALVTGDLAGLVSGAVQGRGSDAERTGFAFHSCRWAIWP